ncbi:anti-sigma factor domain-containing protein [Mucilaginibacter sp. AW1-3]
MEDVKAYMETGILELYVLGDISRDERKQVEEMAAKHPEIKAEIAAIERGLEAYALENEVEPSAQLRNRILNSLVTTFADDSKFPTREFLENDIDDEVDEAEPSRDKVIALPSAKANSFYKYAFAACLAALIASIAAIYSLNQRLNDSYGQIASLQSRNQNFVNRVNLMQGEINIFHDPAYKLIKLQGTPKAPASQLTVAWNPAQKKVMIDMQAMKLATNDDAHQYQLWAIVNGKPVDLGVFDAKPDSTGMVEMNPVANAAAFAVTLEKRGGVPSPTMSEMVVMASI